MNCLRRGQRKRQNRQKSHRLISSYSTVEHLEDRTLLAGASLVNIEPNIDLSLTEGEIYNEAPTELTFKFTPDQEIDPATLGGIQIVRAGENGIIDDINDTNNDDIIIQPGYIGIGDSPNEVILRFAEPLPDDFYQISIYGNDVLPDPLLPGIPATGITALLNQYGEAFQDGIDQHINFELDLGAKVVAVVPQPVAREQVLTIEDASLLEDGDTFTIAVDGTSVTFEMDENSAPGVSGANIAVAYTAGDTDSDIATAILAAFNTSSLGTSATISQSGNDLHIEGDPLSSPTISYSLNDPGSISNQESLTIKDNQIVVYFNDDPLYLADAENVLYYQLIDTVSNTIINPDALVDPVVYDAAENKVTLTFQDPIIDGTYHLRIGEEATPNFEPADVVSVADDDNSSFNTAYDLGTLTTQTIQINEAITPQAINQPPLPGGNDEPGHREITIEQHIEGPEGTGTDPLAVAPIPTIEFYFPEVYFTNSFGIELYNEITENQKQRAREIFELYSFLAGFEVQETTGSGIAIVTGDVRALDEAIPPTAPGGIADSTMAIMNGTRDWGDSPYGGGWFTTALHEIGHAIGLGHSYDLPSIMGSAEEEDAVPLPGERIFPTNYDITHLNRIHPALSNDIDLHKFQLDDAGRFTAEITADRSPTKSFLDSVLTLYREDPMGVFEVVARNDDYFGEDAFLDLELEAGTYYLAVTSVGNTEFDPTVSDSGYGGRTDGEYTLDINFTPAPPISSVMVDATGVALDGDADGTPGGVFDFWFQSSTDTNTIFVDKTAPELGADGSLSNPFNNIQKALNQVELNNNPLSGGTPGTTKIVRIVGNGGTDNDISTIGDNEAYLIGLNDSFQPLEDGATFEIPQNVTVMVDQGAIIKLQKANIEVGSNDILDDRSQGALQILGTPDNQVHLTAYGNDAIGGDDDGLSDGANRGDWGGIVFRADSDLEDFGVFLNSVNNASISYGGGSVSVNSILQTFSPIHAESARPTIWQNTIFSNADSAISADPRSFEDSRFEKGSFIKDRYGLEIFDNQIFDNSVNGLFVRINTAFGNTINKLDVPGIFNDDLTHVITENLQIYGAPGGQLVDGAESINGRLKINAGTVVKLSGARIEAERGSAQLIAEGTEENPIIFTSLSDDRYGAGTTFDTSNDGFDTSDPDDLPYGKGNWGGIILNAASSGSIDHALITNAGGLVPIEGGFANFNAIEVHQAEFRISNSILENNASGQTGSNRNGRGNNDSATIFVRGAQPIIVDNIFQHNDGTVVSIDANSLNYKFKTDYGRSTGFTQAYTQYPDNHGALVRLNRMEDNGLNGMEVRAALLDTETIWDDTDIVHILRDEIQVNQHHTFSGIRLQSNIDEGLVVKLAGSTAGFTANGVPLDINDRIGGTVQIIGQPGFPVVLTSLADDTVGASFTPDGTPQTDTNNDGSGSTPSAGDWRSIRLDRYSNDRNVVVRFETEGNNTSGVDTNSNPGFAQNLGELAPDEVSGDENRALGFEVHGNISADAPDDVDVYSFKATAGTRIWIDIDRTSSSLNTTVELIDIFGTVIASSLDSFAGTFTGSADPLLQTDHLLGDFYSQNINDAGFSVELPDPSGTGAVGTYFVRVRSEGGLTSGQYQMQVRLRQVDEKPGSTVRYADIRYPTNGIEVLGQPAHSPLLGESSEKKDDPDTTVSSNENNNTLDDAQGLGNLLTSDRNTLSVSGTLHDASDVDWYTFEMGYDLIQVIGGSSDAAKTFSTIFDIDYADGLSRADTTISIFNNDGQLILVSRDSDIDDDQADGDTEDLSRGSFGKLDPYIGTAQLPASNPTDNPLEIFRYHVAISSNARLPEALNATFESNALNTQIRLEPVSSVKRIVEDHIGFSGYVTGNSLTENTSLVVPEESNGIFDISNTMTLSTNVTGFSLEDVNLYVSQSTRLRIVDPFDGHVSDAFNENRTIDVGALATGTADITIRSDGRLYSYESVAGLRNNTAGRLRELNAGNASTINSFNDGIPDPPTTGSTDPVQLTTQNVGALAFERLTTALGASSVNYNLFYAVHDFKGTTDTSDDVTTIYQGNPNNGDAGDNKFNNGNPTNAQFTVRGDIDRDMYGLITGMSYRGINATASQSQLYAVTDTGQFLTINQTSGSRREVGAVSGVDLSGQIDGTLVGLTAAPQNLNHGAFRNYLFAITDTGNLYAIDPSGSTPAEIILSQVIDPGLNLTIGGGDDTLIDVFAGGVDHINVGVGGVTGLAFSPLDFNLWHPTFQRNDDSGHGINNTFDETRTDTDRSIRTAFPTPVTFPAQFPNGLAQTESQGGASFYFGFEEWSGTTPDNQEYIRYDTDAQYGVISQAFQSDLSTNNEIGDNYNIAGGAHGSLESTSFNLDGYKATDLPTLYFNYFLETENANTVDNNLMRDAARVFISDDGGVSWEQLATNNSDLADPRDPNSGELSNFISASNREGAPNGNQRVQEMFDNTGVWRQARVDLSEFVNRGDLTLRFDFSTSATINADASSPGGEMNGDQFGDPDRNLQAQNNDHEGFYIDDIIIGFAERGEMVTGAQANQTNFYNLPQNDAFEAPIPLLEGSYQLEIRSGTQYATPPESGLRSYLQIQSQFDTNDRLVREIIEAGDTLNDQLGDRNLERQQGHILIESNTIRSASEYGINIDAGQREMVGAGQTGFSLRSQAGGVRNLPSLNDSYDIFGQPFDPDDPYLFNGGLGFAPGVTVQNNVIVDYTSGEGGIRVSGDDNSNVADNPAAVSYTKVVNNTLSGGEITDSGPAPLSEYSIDVVFTDSSLTASQRAIFQQAAARWSEIILGDVPDVMVAGFGLVDDLVIEASAPFIDGVGGILGSAGPRTVRNGSFIPASGVMRFDSADIAALEASGQLVDVILHEMGHVIGIGTIWQSLGLVIDLGTTDPRFVGPEAIAQYNALLGRSVVDVPVANTGGGGTFGSHWRESDLDNELMTGYLNSGVANPISTITIGSLADLGYVVNLNAADNYPLQAPGAQLLDPVPVGEMLDAGPFTILDASAFVSSGADVTANAITPAGRGILVENYATTTILNNVIANTGTAIDLQTPAGIPNVVGATVFKGNNSTGTLGTNAIQLTDADPLFVNPEQGNFYLADNSKAIDSSLNSLSDRPEFVDVKDPVGMPNSDIFSPDYDAFGQLRIDDPTQTPPPGLGSNIFKDRGAIERADFVGPTARITLPEDNDANDVDLDDDLTEVYIADPELFTTMIVELRDSGIGVDDSLVNSSQFILTATTSSTQSTLIEGTDYLFNYNSNTNEAIFTSIAGVFSLDTLYTIDVRNTDFIDINDPTNNIIGIKDLAGNDLQPNRDDLTTAFTIVVTDAANDPPVNHFGGTPIPASPNLVVQTESEASFVFTSTPSPGYPNGNALSVTDSDAFLGDGLVQVTLTAVNGTVALGSTPAGITIDPGSTANNIIFTGLIDDVNLALERTTWTPDTGYYTSGSMATLGAATLTMTTNDLTNFDGAAEEDTDVIEIIVNDPPLVQFSSATYNVTETDGVTTTTLDVTLTRDKVGGVSTVLVSDLLTGSASSGVDYDVIPANTQVSFAADELTTTFSITIQGDDIVERDETIDLEISGAFFNALIVNPDPFGTPAQDTATVTIDDNDQAVLSINTVDQNEDAGTVEFTISLSKQVDADVSVDVMTQDGTAFVTGGPGVGVGNNDYTLFDSNISIGALALSNVFSVSVNSDNIVELDEYFDVIMDSLSLDANGLDVVLGMNGRGNIINDDSATISIVGETVSEDIATGLMTFTVSLTNQVAGDISFFASTQDSTATIADNDYEQLIQQPVTVAAGLTSTTFTVMINDDETVELSEDLIAVLSDLQNNNFDVVFDTGLTTEAIGTIQNDDSASFIISDVTSNEANGPFVFAVTMTNAVDFNVKVNAETVDGTALAADNDYTQLNTGDELLTFTAGGPLTQIFTVDVTDDNKVELDEVFTTILSNLNAGGRNVSIAGALGTGTIQNDDQAIISISNKAQLEDEDTGGGSGVFTFTVAMSNPVDVDIEVHVATLDGSAKVIDNDYTPITLGDQTITFTEGGSLLEEFDVQVTVDNIVELDETFQTILDNLMNSGRNVILGTNGTGIIQNDDSALITINDVTGQENGGPLTFTATISNPVDTNISFDVSTQDGNRLDTSLIENATVADNDFTAILNEIITFTAGGSTTQTFTVDVTGDDKVELNEVFNVLMSNLVNNGRSVTLDTPAQGTIENDDIATLTINNITERESNGPFTFTVTLSNEVDTDIIVEAATMDGTAIAADGDYTALEDGDRVITFVSGSPLTQTFTVDVSNENLVEADEVFSTFLKNLENNGRMVSTVMGDGEATILNDDSATLSITPVIDTENNTPFEFLVELSNPVDVTITVDASTLDGSAIASSDYEEIVNKMLTFNPNVTQLTVDVTIIDDATTEGPETFELVLGNLDPNDRDVFLTSITARSSSATTDAAIAVDVLGDFAYVADRDGGLQIFNIADPSNPIHTGSFDFNQQGIAQGIDVVGNLAYLAVGEAGLQILDISDPTNPTFVGNFDTLARARGVQVIGNLAYVADDSGNGGGLQIIDVSAPGTPVKLGSFGVATPGGLAGGVKVIGNIAYVTDGNNGLRIIDVSDSSTPTEIHNVATPDGAAIGLDVVGNFAYVANREGGLQIIDISDPFTASIVADVDTPGVATGVRVAGNFAYVADGTAGLHVIDLSKLEIIRTHNTPGSARNLFVQDTLAFVADTFNGLEILEFIPSTSATGTILDPGAPPLTGTASVNSTINTSLVLTPTTTDANDETATIPESEQWIDEWDSFWIEVWGNTSDGAGISGGSFDLKYNTDYFTATAVEYGAAFGGSSSSSINDLTGTVSGISGQNNLGTLGSGNQVLLARVKFESTDADGVAIDQQTGFLGPHSLGINVTNAQLDITDFGGVNASVAELPTTDLWAVPFDLDDNGVINNRDLVTFISFYGTSVLDSSSGLAWSLDFDKNGQINIRDLRHLINNYNLTKASGQQVAFPSNFPQEWYGSPITTDGEASLNVLIEAAIDEWKTATGNDQLAVQVFVTDLGGQQLGEGHILELDENGVPVKGRIYIDDDASGLGWYSSIEGLAFDSNGQAIAGSAAEGHYDLYTVLLHEIGHAAGFTTSYSAFTDHVFNNGSGQVQFVGWDFVAPLTNDGLHIDESFFPNDLMGATLDPSTRKTISILDVQILQAAYENATGAVITPLTAPLMAADESPTVQSTTTLSTKAAFSPTAISLPRTAPAVKQDHPAKAVLQPEWNYAQSQLIQNSIMSFEPSTNLDELAGSLIDVSYDTAQYLADEPDKIKPEDRSFRFDFDHEFELDEFVENEAVDEELDSMFTEWSGPLV
ncbi:Calx-beta domain-containing protein [Gimesia fumaroli]|uniref:Calx-beta domain-containing protein n=1 Tax=Gimesia fumaroli TaxID=2527976 RepID=UPI0018D8D40D|nr:Calx-beta domain-containing protein [Gimesia fumaroli]